MTHGNAIFSQILKLVPRHEFGMLANGIIQAVLSEQPSRWSQFVTHAITQLAGRISLGDIVENISLQAHRLYHLGSVKLTRARPCPALKMDGIAVADETYFLESFKG